MLEEGLDLFSYWDVFYVESCSGGVGDPKILGPLGKLNERVSFLRVFAEIFYLNPFMYVELYILIFS